MDVKLDHLIEKIKRDGVEEAQQSANKVLVEAREKARKIVEMAQQEAEDIRERAEREADKMRENGEVALKHAARNTQLLVKEQLNKLFERVLLREVRSEMTADFMTDIIRQVLKQWRPDSEVEIAVSEKDQKLLNDKLLSQLKNQLDHPVTLKVNPNLTGGFRLSRKGESLAFDFSDESISEALKLFLNPHLRKIMDQSNG